MMKRSFDFIASVTGLLVFSPILFLLLLLIRLESSGSPLFRQKRVGRGGIDFNILKLRTMRVTGDGAKLTIGQDKRITRIGRWLRATKLDELPQLWNVVRGQMSLVGPRPEIRYYVDMYTPDQKKVLELKPGVTDPSSFAMFNEAEVLSRVPDPEGFYVRFLMPEKIRINLEYASVANFGTDLLLIIATVGKIFGIRFDIFKHLKITPPNLHFEGSSV
jgi:lipopolysaccharide/colanic/teichoic acid biosynthesis glycosyltransferase